MTRIDGTSPNRPNPRIEGDAPLRANEGTSREREFEIPRGTTQRIETTSRSTSSEFEEMRSFVRGSLDETTDRERLAERLIERELDRLAPEGLPNDLREEILELFREQPELQHLARSVVHESLRVP